MFQRRMQNPVLDAAKSSILHVWLGSKFASVFFHVNFFELFNSLSKVYLERLLQLN